MKKGKQKNKKRMLDEAHLPGPMSWLVKLLAGGMKS